MLRWHSNQLFQPLAGSLVSTTEVFYHNLYQGHRRGTGKVESSLGVPNPGCISTGSKIRTSAKFGGCTHVATPQVATWCYIKVSTNQLDKTIHRNQAASPNPMFPSPHVGTKVGFRDTQHHQNQLFTEYSIDSLKLLLMVRYIY